MNNRDEFKRITRKLTILLADDDAADCLLFKDALDTLPVSVKLTVVHDGEQLMQLLDKKPSKLPDVLFLDLNMPRKNGFATLGEIKRNKELQDLPVVIFTTANDPDKVNQVYKDAAHYYIRKPAEFGQLMKVIYEALALTTQKNNTLPVKEKFILTGDSKKDNR